MITLEKARQLALSFDHVVELPHFEKASFRVKKKIFATLDVSKMRMVIKLNEADQSAFSAFDNSVIYPVSGAWGKQGWTIVELDKVVNEVFEDALKVSYNLVAAKRNKRNDDLIYFTSSI